MTTYILLNSRHELGGYIVFSGGVFDHDFSENEIINPLNEDQIKKLQNVENYHIIATHSFGLLLHTLPEQPTHKIVRNWLEERIENNKK